MVVAIAILGLVLGALYRLAGGATRTVAVDEKMGYGVELARSLLANYAVVPLQGLQEEGETAGGFRWQVIATPLSFADEVPLLEGQLQDMRVLVTWADGDRQRQFALDSVVAGMEPEE